MFGTLVVTSVGLSLLAIGVQEAIDARVDRRRLASRSGDAFARATVTTEVKADRREIPFELPKAA